MFGKDGELMRYDTECGALVAGVREVCELVLRSGSIDGRRHGALEKDLSKIHSALQKSRGALYNREVPLLNTTSYGDVYYQISGRADGVVFGDSTEQGQAVLVEEIKVVSGYEMALPPRKKDLAQLMCYAYFLTVQREIEYINTRLTYFEPESEKERNFDRVYSADELRIFYRDLLSKLEPWAQMEKFRAEEALPSLKNAVFPYKSLRSGQREFIGEAFSAIKRGKRLFAQAPTGTGKTVSSLYPAVRAIGHGICDKVFYLTAKSSTSREAYNAVGKLFGAGAKLRTVMIGAKEQVCLCEAAKGSGLRVGSFCNPDDCPYARGYYDRLNGAILDILSRQNGYNLSILKEISIKHSVCPYELSLDLSELCDVVICDYNYLFSPTVYMRRYFSDGGERGKYVFLIDEAHNLGARARDMYSSEQSRNRVSECLDILGAYLESHIGEYEEREKLLKLREIFEAYSSELIRLRRLCKDNLVKVADGSEQGFYLSRSPTEKFNLSVEAFVAGCESWLKANRDHPLYPAVSSVCSEARQHLLVLEYYDNRFLTYVAVSGGDIKIRIYCLDPSDVLDRCMRRGVASVLFSATLTPLDYFSDLLGGGKNTETLALPSPFKQENLFVAAVDSVSTRFDDRNEKNYRRIAAVIAATVSPKPGNYIVYFPSYSFMEEVCNCFSKKYPSVKLLIQKKGMTRAEREKFIASFKEDEGKLRIGMCVLGGSFSEGVDLPGSMLIGTVVVGVGLPGLSNENNIIKEYYDVKSECGYDYAYTFPGMNNVLQAAGRVIRRDSDKGVVVLVDDRYGEDRYKMLFPPQWSHMIFTGDVSSLAKAVTDFWRENSNDKR